MRILIGTLHCGENEFDECVEGIQQQRYADWEHFVVEHLPNKEAHDRLYGTFMERAAEFDLFLKVDADMVIENPCLLSAIADKFRRRPEMLHYGIPVYDFFSDQLIPEMNAFRSTVTWQSQDDVFPDTSWITPEAVVRDTELAPAAVHCKNPSDFQAFHYGLHKAVKIIQAGRRKRNESRAKLHWSILTGIWKHLERLPDRRLALAALGGELALARRLGLEHVNYHNKTTRAVFEGYTLWNREQLESEARRLRRENWGWLPEACRLLAVSAPASGIPGPSPVAKRLLRGASSALARPLTKLRRIILPG